MGGIADIAGSAAGGDGGASAASDAIQTGLKDALRYAELNYNKALDLQKYMYDTGIKTLNQFNAQAQGNQIPYSYSGMNAYDRLLRSTGQAPPSMGSFQLSQAVSNFPKGETPTLKEADLDKALQAYQADPWYAQGPHWADQTFAALNAISNPAERIQAKYAWIDKEAQHRSQYLGNPSDPGAVKYTQANNSWIDNFVQPLRDTYAQQQKLTPADFQLAQIANNTYYGNPDQVTNTVTNSLDPNATQPAVKQSDFVNLLNQLPSIVGTNDTLGSLTNEISDAINGRTRGTPATQAQAATPAVGMLGPGGQPITQLQQMYFNGLTPSAQQYLIQTQGWQQAQPGTAAVAGSPGTPDQTVTPTTDSIAAVLQKYMDQYSNTPGNGGTESSQSWAQQAKNILDLYNQQKANPSLVTNPAGQTLTPGSPGTYSTDAAKQGLQDFFNTPQYQLLFGNSGAQVDPNASVLQRFQTNPGYQFQMDEGLNQIQRQQAAKGQLESGTTLKGLNTFAQGTANQEFNNYQSKLSSTFGAYQQNLMQLAGMGQQASNVQSGLSQTQGQDQTNLGSNYANANSSIYTSLGNLGANIYNQIGQAQAQKMLAQGQQQSGLASGLGSLFGGGGGGGMFGGGGGLF